MTQSTERNNSYTVLAVLILVAIQSTWFVSGVHGSQLVMHNIESQAIADNMMGISSIRHIEVYLPDGYEDGNRQYPVLYWIPGGGGVAAASFYKIAIDDAIQARDSGDTMELIKASAKDVLEKHTNSVLGKPDTKS